MRLAIAGLVLALAMASAQAQISTIAPSSQIGQHAEHAEQAKGAEQKPKVDEKAYSAALRNLPDKQYDPWHGVR